MYAYMCVYVYIHCTNPDLRVTGMAAPGRRGAQQQHYADPALQGEGAQDAGRRLRPLFSLLAAALRHQLLARGAARHAAWHPARAERDGGAAGSVAQLLQLLHEPHRLLLLQPQVPSGLPRARPLLPLRTWPPRDRGSPGFRQGSVPRGCCDGCKHAVHGDCPERVEQRRGGLALSWSVWCCGRELPGSLQRGRLPLSPATLGVSCMKICQGKLTAQQKPNKENKMPEDATPHLLRIRQQRIQERCGSPGVSL